jgi:hypothetical protein
MEDSGELPKQVNATEVVKPAETSRREGPFNIGNLELYALPIEHRKADWVKHQSEVKEALSQYQTVIVEYFPSEYAQLKQEPGIGKMLGNYDEANFLFDKVAEVAKETGKDLWVLDPAYNKDFMKIKGAQGASLLLTLGSAATLKVSDELAARGKGHSRRRFLSGAAGLLAASAIPGTVSVVLELGAHHLSPPITEHDLRRVVVSKGLSQVSGKALLIYPPAHWRDIKGYIQDPKDMQTRFSYYEKLKEIGLDSLFQARHYKVADNEWKLEEKLPIT